jgi:hypothetical protein
MSERIDGPEDVPPAPPAARFHWAWLAGGIAALLVTLLVIFLVRHGSNGGVESAQPGKAGRAPAAANAVAPAPPVADIRSRPPGEQLAAAFRAAFGRDGPVTRTVNDATITYNPGGLRWIGPRAILISPGDSNQQCHSCSGALAVHYLEASGGGFRVTGAWLDGGGGASWGQPPDWSFSSLLSTEPMLESRGGWGGQGITCTTVSYYEFTPQGPQAVANIQLSYDDRNSAFLAEGQAATSLDGRILNVIKDRSFDVAYRGTARFTEHYARTRGPYVRTPRESRLQC